MLIYDSILSDHKKVLSLLEQLVELTPTSNKTVREKLLAQIRDELIPHSRAEEAVLYNSIRAINSAQDIVWHSYAEHMEAEGLLRTLQAASVIDAGWQATARKLQEALQTHIAEEESKVIPVARQLFTKEEAEAMNDVFNEVKPQVKNEGIVQTTLDLVANMMPDRLAGPLRTFTFEHRAH